MNYENWLRSVPATITDDTLWKVEVYRLSLFAADPGWHVLGEAVTAHLMSLLTQVIRLFLTMVPDQRGSLLHQDGLPYRNGAAALATQSSFEAEGLTSLLTNTPLD